MKDSNILNWATMNHSNPVPECKEAIEKYRLYHEVLAILRPWTLCPENNESDIRAGIRLCFNIYRKLYHSAELSMYASLPKSMGNIWLRQIAKCMI